MNIETAHPLLMVSEVVTFSVVLYWTGTRGADKPVPQSEALRQAIIRMLPAGTGVGDVDIVLHGQYQYNEPGSPA